MQLLRIFGAKVIVYSIRGHKYVCSMHGRGDSCMHHAWKGEPCILHAWRGELMHEACMDGITMHVPWMEWWTCACIMHDTCIHA